MELPAQQFSTWIRPLQAIGDKNPNNEVTIAAPNRFILKWVRDNYLNTFQRLADEFYEEPVTVVFSVGAASAAADLPTRSSLPTNPTQASAPHQATSSAHSPAQTPAFKSENVRESASQTIPRKTNSSLNGQARA